MDILVVSPQLGPSLHFNPPQMGSNPSKAVDRICWRTNVGGDCFSSCSTSAQPLWASYSSSLPTVKVKGSQRTPIEQHQSNGREGKAFRHRMSRGLDQATPRRIMVRSFVDEATAHSSELELDIQSDVAERLDGEAGEQDLDDAGNFRGTQVAERDDSERNNSNSDGQYMPGIKTVEADSLPSMDLEYNYEDMRLGEKKNWSIVDMKKMDVLRNFEYRYGSEKGVMVVQAMRVEHMKATEELLVDSFAELMGGLLTYRPLLALTVRQYVRDRYACLPDAVTLVGLYAPVEDNVVMGRTENGNWLLAGTVELSFSNDGHPDIPAGPAPPPGSPYLCNMAVSNIYRRRGLGRQLLKAAEELAVLIGAQDLYLHCRMVDVAPLNMYLGAGYQIVATDSILSLLNFQRRRYLMRKRLNSCSVS